MVLINFSPLSGDCFATFPHVLVLSGSPPVPNPILESQVSQSFSLFPTIPILGSQHQTPPQITCHRAMVARRRSRTGAVAVLLLAAAVLREAFVVPGGRPLPRAALRLFPALLGAAPAWAEKGVTTAWKTRPDGGEDEIHTGGVEWEDVKVGTGASPQIGDQIGLRYVLKAYVREREVIVEDNTKGKAKDFRFGVGQLLPGMDEGIAGMKTGGVRKLRIPGNLAFGEKALPSAPGRMALPPFQPVEAVVTLDFIPGADAVYDYGEMDEEK